MVASTVPGRRILLVEDEPTLQRILGSVLVDAGHAVESVGTAEAAIEYLESDNVDLVLSDKNLPGLSGLDLLERLRELDAGREQPCAFILVTGYPSRDSAISVLDAGGDGYLVKPFRSLVDAVARIERALVAPLPERRKASQIAAKVCDLLTGVPADLKLDCALVLLEPGDERTRIEACFARAAVPVMHDPRAVRGDRVAAIAARVDDLADYAATRQDAALLLANGGASFADLVALISAGGGRVFDPTMVPAT
jgi:CheY-like chemotaxis protein